MVDGDNWAAAAADLKKVPWVEIGLHVVLTDQRKALTGASPLAPDGRFGGRIRLAAGAMSGWVSNDAIQSEIGAQITRFLDGMSRYPTFIDTHQTVHLYPRIGAALTEAISKSDARWRPWLRVCSEQLSNIMRRKHGRGEAAAASVASLSLARAARRRSIRVNEGFSGFYDVRQAPEFSQIFPFFLSGLGPRHLVMCHPGFCDNDDERSDVWMRNREHEFAYFTSDAFINCLNSHGVTLQTFNELNGAHTT